MINPSQSTLRPFGITVGGTLLALGLWCVDGGELGLVCPGFSVAGGMVLPAGVAAPRSLARPYSCWIALTESLAFAMTQVFLLLHWPQGEQRRVQADGLRPLR